MKPGKPHSIKLSLYVSVADTAREYKTREYELGHQGLYSLLFALDEVGTDEFFWSAMARHPSADVREIAARSERLEDADFLLDDASVEVRVAAIEFGLDERRFNLGTSEVIHLVESDDVRVAKAIAANLGKFPEADRDDVIAALCKHPDPGVRLVLTENGRPERRRLRALAQDEDVDVARVAKAAAE